MRNDILNQKTQILSWIEEAKPKTEIAVLLKCKVETLNTYLNKMGINYIGQQNKKGQHKGTNIYKTANYYIENNINIPSYRLKAKLILDGLKENKCEICGITTWNNVELPLELHHKDGNHFNNELNNLQILCPNCHSIQEGNSGSNIGKYSTNQKIRPYSTINKKTCIDCDQPISHKATRCKKCATKFNTIVNPNLPTRIELKALIRQHSFVMLGKKYNVTANTIRNWCKSYNLPYRTSDIKVISDLDWEQI